jgi:hypothetical protein
MSSTALGVTVALIGLSLVVRGYATIRAIISLFGGLIGFAVGAYAVARFTNTPLLQNQTGWIGGAIGAVVFGLLAFFVYRFAMIGGMAAIGYTLGVTALVALHVDNPWASLAAGILGAIVLAIVAYRFDLPGLVLVLLTTLVGASLVTLGAMLTMAKVTLLTFSQASVTAVVAEGWGWYALYLGLVALGLVLQWRYLKVRKSVRSHWGKNKS